MTLRAHPILPKSCGWTLLSLAAALACAKGVEIDEQGRAIVLDGSTSCEHGVPCDAGPTGAGGKLSGGAGGARSSGGSPAASSGGWTSGSGGAPGAGGAAPGSGGKSGGGASAGGASAGGASSGGASAGGASAGGASSGGANGTGGAGSGGAAACPKYPTEDACSTCICQKCASQVDQCFNSSDSAKNTTCASVQACAEQKHCASDSCYCTNPTSLTCALTPDGPCASVINAAVNGGGPAAVQQASNDTSTPVGRANAIGKCSLSNCKSECGL